MISWNYSICKYPSGKSFGVVYCNNVGNILKYKLGTKEEFEEGGTILTYTDDFVLLTGGKPTYSRVMSCVGCSPWSYSQEEEQEKERLWLEYPETLRKGLLKKHPDLEVGFECNDPRLVRAYILAWYEFWKGAPIEEIDNLLNDSVDWSGDEAGSWLLKNDFHYSKDYVYLDPNREDNDYLFDVTKLINPYWQPKRKRD